MTNENHIGAWQARVMSDPKRPGAWLPAADNAWAKSIYETCPNHTSAEGIEVRPIYGDNVIEQQVKAMLAAYSPAHRCNNMRNELNDFPSNDFNSRQTGNSQTVARAIKRRKRDRVASFFKRIFKWRSNCECCNDTGNLPNGRDCDSCTVADERAQREYLRSLH
jgi:hypothetical protein